MNLIITIENPKEDRNTPDDIQMLKEILKKPKGYCAHMLVQSALKVKFLLFHKTLILPVTVK